jgi:hypothetical protein
MQNSRRSRFSCSLRWRLLVGLWVLVVGVGQTPHASAATPSWLRQDDAYVIAAEPDANTGSMTHLLVDGGQDPQVASYLRFTVSGVTAPIERATLRLWVRENGFTQDGPDVRITGTAWTETDLTWNTRPYPAGTALDDAGPLDPDTWVEYDVTPAVSGNGLVAFVLVGQSSDGAVFVSREGDQPPQLVITLQGQSSTQSPPATPESTAEPTAGPTLTPEPTATPTPPSGETATLLAAGDIAECASEGDEATAALLDGRPGTIATLGDTVYEAGTTREFADCYDPSWGRHKDRTRPAVGNHEYLTPEAADYFRYFGAAAGDPQQGYYSYELGAWHIVVLNSNCSQVGGCHQGSPQEQWLRADLAAHPTACTLAYWHHPRFSFGKYDDNEATRVLWQVLQGAGAEIVLSGHDHNYQRYVPQDAGGVRDDARGIREFVVGTGGKDHYSLGTPPPNVEKFNGDTFGVLQLTLQATGYEWTFVPEADKTFTDMGADTCH